MTNFRALIAASTAGSIGAKYNERRTYVITASDIEAAKAEAIARAHQEGLEHVLVIRIAEEASSRPA
jgi:hypothetical protein